MNIWLYLMGIGIGLAASAPVGPVNIMAISRALQGGFILGFTTGLGAVVADAMIAGFSGMGLPWLIELVENHQSIVQIAGGALLVIFGIAMTRTHPKINREENLENRGIFAAPVSAFMMTLSNPGAILAIVAVFGSMSGTASEVSGLANVGLMVLGMLTGGTIWWATVSWGASTLRDRMTDDMLFKTNFIGGVLIILFGVGLGLFAIGHLSGWIGK